MFRSVFICLLLAFFGLNVHAGGPSSLTFTKAFGAANIPLNGTTSLTFTMVAGADNGNGNVGNFGFTDTLPPGLVVATPNGGTALTPLNCLGADPGLTIIGAQGSNQVSVTAARVASNSACRFSVNVTGTTPGLKANSVTAAGNIGAGGNVTATANLMVGEAPANIPSLSQWGLLVSMALLALTAVWAFKRRAKPALRPPLDSA